MFKLDIKIQGVKKVTALFKNMTKGLNNFKIPLEDSSRYLGNEIDINFNQEGARLNSRGWKALTPATLKQKNKKYPSRPILVRTGRMRKSFQHSVTRDRLEISNSSDYFKFHQSNRPRKVLPRRVMLNIMRRQITEITGFFGKYLDKLTK